MIFFNEIIVCNFENFNHYETLKYLIFQCFIMIKIFKITNNNLIKKNHFLSTIIIKASHFNERIFLNLVTSKCMIYI